MKKDPKRTQPINQQLPLTQQNMTDFKMNCSLNQKDDINSLNIFQPSQNPFQTCNEGIANGFGAMFFNLRDPNFTQKNEPVRQNSSKHIPILVMTIILFACVVIGVVGFYKLFSYGVTIGLIVGSFCLYLCISCICSDIRPYLSNIKKFEDYERIYNKMVNGQGFFHFWIQCYHYVTVRTKNGTSRRKVVTHTANEIYNVTVSVDQSGELSSIIDIKKYIFLHYLKRYYFTDEVSQDRFVAAFNRFVSRNTRDQYQCYRHTFDVHGFEEFVGFTASGQTGHSHVLFYVLTIIGFGLPYACFMERNISRYNIGILKRLTI